MGPATLVTGRLQHSNTSSSALGELWFAAFMPTISLSISLIHTHSFLSMHLPLCMHSCHGTGGGERGERPKEWGKKKKKV